MAVSTVLFWNVDTQNDFVNPDGKLYVKGAERLKSKWAKLTELARNKSIQVVNTADFHFPNSKELSQNPDFIQTFPQHCMANTTGAEFINETNPENPVIFDWNKNDKTGVERMDLKNRNIVIRKDAFDVFSGNPLTNDILKTLNPETVVVYGVTTNVCVDFAVKGLAQRVKNIYVIEDAVKELATIPLPTEHWKKLGVKLIQLDDLVKLYSKP